MHLGNCIHVHAKRKHDPVTFKLGLMAPTITPSYS